MTVHLLKLCVGIDSVDRLAEVQAGRLAETKVLFHRTRHTPRRARQVLDNGSIYWIIGGFVRVRQRIVGIERRHDPDGRPFCTLLLSPELVRTELQPRRPHQGWRYLDARAAPSDLPPRRFGDDGPPEEMAAELRALGLI